MINEVNNHSLIPSTDVIQLSLTVKMTNNVQVVETSVTVNNSSTSTKINRMIMLIAYLCVDNCYNLYTSNEIKPE